MTEGGSAQERPTLVFFSSKRSGPARRMASLIAWVHVTEKNRLRVVEVDADANEPLMSALDVDTVPALVLLDEDSHVIARHEGRATGPPDRAAHSCPRRIAKGKENSCTSVLEHSLSSSSSSC